jgi:hypothetical protein
VKSKILILLLPFLAIACTKDGGTGSGGNNGNGNNTGGGNNNGGSSNAGAMIIMFENSNFNGSATVAYTDGSSVSANFQAGVLKLPLSATRDKTIKSLTPQNQPLLLIGRTEGDSIILNYNNGILNFRSTVVDSYVPIATYAEFQLINAPRYELKADLDLMNEEWAPLGSLSEGGFNGVFEGGNHKLKNLKQTVSTNNPGGLFGYVNGNNIRAEIRNLIISSGSITSSQANIGGIAGLATGGVTINGCQNYASLTSNSGNVRFAGGIVGEIGGSVNGGGTFTIKNSANYGEISVAKSVSGGVVGGALFFVGFTIDSCTNAGIVRATNVGGIVGGMPTGNTPFRVSNCSNKGNITAVGIAGGIVGYGVPEITNCHNSGNITCSDGYEVGGIAGRSIGVINSHNEGTISVNIPEGVSSPVIGGVVGNLITNAGASNPNNYNTGSITVNITRVYKNGIVVGGVIGAFPTLTIASLVQSYNTGAITISGSHPDVIIGGLIGSASWNHTLSYSFNTGAVISTSGKVGGLIGFAGSANPYYTSVFRCYWLDNASDNAINAVSNWVNTLPAYTDIKKFSATAWPSVSEGWTTGNGTNNAFWKSLGGWNNGNPVYPKLFYEK